MKTNTLRQALISLLQALFLATLFFFYLFGATLFAQHGINPHFEFYSVDEGLSENSISTVMQDRHGFIWIGTSDGLNRYDGYSYKTYRHDPNDPSSLSYNSIGFIFEDSEGGLWVETKEVPSYGGKKILNRLDWSTGKFERFEHDPDDPNSISSEKIKDIFEDSRNNIWVLTGNAGLNLFDRATRKFSRYLHDPDDPGSISSNKVTKLFEDSRNNLWVCTEGGGINRYDYQTDRFEAFKFGPDEPESEKANLMYGVMEDAEGILWIGNQNAGLSFLNPSTGALNRYRHDPEDPQSLSDNAVVGAFEDSKKEFWIQTRNGLNQLNRETGKFERFFHEPENPFSLSNNIITCIYEDAQQNLWIGTSDGLNRLDRLTGKFERFRHDPEGSNSLCHNSVNSILEDSVGNLWILTAQGISLFDRKNNAFECFQPDYSFSVMTQDKSANFWLGLGWLATKGLSRMDLVTTNVQHFQHDPQDTYSLIDGVIWPIFEDSDGFIWIGTMPNFGMGNPRGGLNRLNRATGKFEHFRHDPSDSKSIAKNEVFRLFEDSEGNLWVSYNAGVLDRLNRKTGEVVERFFRNNKGDSTTINIGPIANMLEDPEGNLWFGGGSGINKLDKTTGLFQHFLPFPDAENLWLANLAESMVMDSEGFIWIGTLHNGLCRLDPSTGRFEYFAHDPDNPNSLSHNTVISLHEDSRKNLWAGTTIGLNRFDRATGNFNHYFEKDGLPNDFIYGILEDDHGKLWLSTNRGISRFDPETATFHNFDVHDGLQGNQFNYISYFKSSRTGELFFGGINGFNIFHPDSMKVDTFPPPVAISSFTRYSRKEGTPIVDNFISGKEKITLSHRDNIITFEFAALNFRKTPKNQYKYQLAGFSDQWYELGNKREVTFTDLHPGNYTLRVMAANGDGVWNPVPTELEIRILPPWWWTIWTKILYALLATGLLYSLYRFQLDRKLNLAEANRFKEMDAMKTKFYTNITHEFRTPLTVIQGLSDQEIEKQGQMPPEKNLENAQIIKRNSAQLLTMVNQMLDLRRLESGTLPVQLVKGDVLQYFRYLTESFHSYAYDKGVGLHFMTDLEELTIDYDPDKLLHVVSNLLSNAIKFTPEGGNVYFSVDLSTPEMEAPEMLILKVKDTGIGIAEDHLPFIFDRFYQANQHTTKGEGTGIGLALTRELVKLMKGTIEVKSKVEEGTTFIVKLPVTREATVTAAVHASLGDQVLGFTSPARLKEQKKTTATATTADMPLALVIEDNPDVVRYLSSCLEGSYNVVTALNGRTGIDTALDLIPDIIVSDVMMPEKDGFEVCEILKNDERTSHIPIILLTARADQRSRLDGLRKGADAYLAKPFNREELQVRLEQLIELRRKLQERYADLGTDQLQKEAATIEDTFLQKLRQVILDHIADPEFGQVQLSRAIGLSRSQLFRKLKALTGKSTSLVVRSIRLQKAKELLLTTDLNVSEVAYDVGFKDLSYFSKCFMEEFGEQPSAVRC